MGIILSQLEYSVLQMFELSLSVSTGEYVEEAVKPKNATLSVARLCGCVAVWLVWLVWLDCGSVCSIHGSSVYIHGYVYISNISSILNTEYNWAYSAPSTT